MRPLPLALLLLMAAPAAAQVGTLLPVDEAVQDPSFIVFRARMLEAVAARDTAHVLAQLDPNAKFSFGGDDGVEGFRRLWLDGDAGEDLWATLARALALGSTYDSTEAGVAATAPYVFGAWPDSLDAFEHVAVVGEDVRVRAAPSTEADVLAAVSYALLPAVYDTGTPEGWQKVALADGRAGYVAEAFIRSPIGYRIGLTKQDGRWRVTYFLAGD